MKLIPGQHFSLIAVLRTRYNITRKIAHPLGRTKTYFVDNGDGANAKRSCMETGISVMSFQNGHFRRGHCHEHCCGHGRGRLGGEYLEKRPLRRVAIGVNCKEGLTTAAEV